ncbi:hypothetical protein ID866_4386 [Astraeus odoratus]|nr:hypothetical protein ID866_4386 [Astraeus odoratus]
MHQANTAFFTPEDKQRQPHLTSILDTNAQKVIATAAARVYYAPFINPHVNWSCSQLKGIVVFGRDRAGLASTTTGMPAPPLSPPPPLERVGTLGHGPRPKEKYWFRLVDVKTDKVIWSFPIPEVFEYYKDKPFFHYFSGTASVFTAYTRMFGFCFDEDEAADVFFKKVVDRTRRHFFGPFRSRSNSTKKQTKPSNPLKPSKSKSKPPPPPVHHLPIRPNTAPIKPSMISGPTPHSFVHVSHVGISNTGAIESSKNVEPAWSALIADLQGYGFESEGEVVSEAGHGHGDGSSGINADFMEGFLAGAKAVKDRLASASTSSEAQNSTPVIRRKPTLTFAPAPTPPPAPSRALSPVTVPSSPPAPAPAPLLPTTPPAQSPVFEPAPIIRSLSPAPGSPPPEKKRKIRRRVLLL